MLVLEGELEYLNEPVSVLFHDSSYSQAAERKKHKKNVNLHEFINY